MPVNARSWKYRPAPKPTPPTADVASCVELINHQKSIRSISNINDVLIGPYHQSDWTWLARSGVLAGRQLAVEVDLEDLDRDYRVGVTVLGIHPEGVHYRRVGTEQVDHYYTAQEGLVMPPECRWAEDKKEGSQGSSPRNWRGTVLAFR